MTPPIDTRGVTRHFGDFVAVDQVGLGVERGEIVGLLGANGAGKTTLIRMILGLLEPTAGTVRLFGSPPSREQRRRIGYVPQNLGLYRDLTMAENLEFRARAFGVGPADTELDGGLVRDLPLGTQRRIAFVAATQHDPELLVLDEPTSGVSPLSRTRLWDLIRGRAEDGAAVLVSTHYMDEAEQADRLVLMSRGRVVASGSVADLVGDRVTSRVRSDSWEDVFAALEAEGHVVTLAGRAIRVLGAEPGEIRRALSSAGLDGDVDRVPATLEETMVALES